MFYRKIDVILTIALLFNFARGGEVAERQEVEQGTVDFHDVPFFQIPKALERIKTTERRLRRQMTVLPQLENTLQFDAYGYHGGYLSALNVLPEKPRWTVEVSFKENARLRQAVIVPAVDRRSDQQRGYGFPKRFRLSTVFPDGRTSVIAEYLTVDCPDPGRLPLVFDTPAPRTNILRLEVFRGSLENGREFLALDEIFGIASGKYHEGRVQDPEADIESFWASRSVSVSSEFLSMPYWSKEFLVDNKTSLGLPLGVKSNANSDSAAQKSDFLVDFDPNPTVPLWIELDLGKNCNLGLLTLFPVINLESVLIPGFGFPGEIHLDAILEGDDGERLPSIRHPVAWTSGNPGENIVRLPLTGEEARWLRLYFGRLSQKQGTSVFAMGEILVRADRKTYPIKSISFSGFPANAEQQATSLMDGRSADRPVMPFSEWITRIERRNDIKQELARLPPAAAALRARWQQFWWLTGITVLLLAMFAALYFASNAKLQQRRHSLALRRQINSDLHDDIGSKLAALVLASRFVETKAREPAVRERGARLQRIATEMNNGLRDVLWLTDHQTDTLPQVMRKLTDCARMGVEEERLDLHFSPIRSLPCRKVEVRKKRDVLLFLREALHNASTHSQASRIRVEIFWKRGNLDILVQDDGIGFQILPGNHTSEASEHRGLQTMRWRADRLGGLYSMETMPDKGTSVQLSVAL